MNNCCNGCHRNCCRCCHRNCCCNNCCGFNNGNCNFFNWWPLLFFF
ncbi:hypothetical protein [Clostridium uliginosum]|nr:hypothetical protein [Clostridium uliginosum]